jgi:hypothetical protein
MFASTRFALATAAGLMIAAQSVSAATLLSDDFNGTAGAAPDTTLWTTYHYSGAGTNTLDGNSHLVANVNTTAYGNYVQTVTKNNDFDAFSAPLTITLDGIAVGGATGVTTTGSNSGWVLYGRSSNDTTSEYHPATTLAYGVSVSIGVTQSGGVNNYKLTLQEYDDNARSRNDSYALNGAPTGLTLNIDGVNRNLGVTLVGTTFTGTGLGTLSQALSTDFTKANLSTGGALTSRISVGAINGGATTTNSTFSVDSIEVSSVPEPASLSLLMGAGLLVGQRRRR